MQTSLALIQQHAPNHICFALQSQDNIAYTKQPACITRFSMLMQQMYTQKLIIQDLQASNPRHALQHG